MNPGKVSEVTYKRAILKNLNSKNEGVKPGVNAANIQLEDITAVVSSNCILKTLRKGWRSKKFTIKHYNAIGI